MDKRYLVSNFVTLRVKRTVTAVCSPKQQMNIYEWLRDQGFGQSLLGRKTIFFQSTYDSIKPSSIIAMRYAFLKFLEIYDFEDWPQGVTRHDLLEWCYTTKPPKRNQFFKLCLFRELSIEEIHQYRMQDDCHYRHRYRMNELIGKLNDWGFKKTVDLKSSFSKDADLYFKKVVDGQYLVFSHYNKNEKNDCDGFDCWLAPFRSEAQIGKILNSHLRSIALTFNIERDLGRIEQYIS